MPNPRPASAKQVSFLEKLHAERGLELPDDLFSLDVRAASTLIDQLMRTPRAAAAHQPPAPRTAPGRPEPEAPANSSIDLRSLCTGRYQIGSAVYAISIPAEGRWLGWAFVRDAAGAKIGAQRPDSFFRADTVGLAAHHLGRIVANPLAALQAYAAAHGVCGMCERELTDDLSRAAGIGPVCAKAWGIDRSAYAELAASTRAARLAEDAAIAASAPEADLHEAAEERGWEEVARRVDRLDVDAELAGIAAAGVLDPHDNPFDVDPDFTPVRKAAFQGPDSLPAAPSVMDGDWA